VAAGVSRGWLLDGAGDPADGAEYAGEVVGQHEVGWLGLQADFAFERSEF
jgi:hypothetical protein